MRRQPSETTRARCALAALALLATPTARPGETFAVEAWGGVPWNPPIALGVDQSGAPPLRFTARYETRPLQLPFYYRLRAILGAGERGEWALELVHHKLYLVNAPREIGSFSVSHGYNLVLASRGWDLGPLWIRAGSGPVVAHPESTVRGRTLDEHGGILGSGQYLAGAAVAVMIERRVTVAGPFYFVLGGMVTAAYARVPVRDGHADVPNVALHALAGAGFQGGQRP